MGVRYFNVITLNPQVSNVIGIKYKKNQALRRIKHRIAMVNEDSLQSVAQSDQLDAI